MLKVFTISLALLTSTSLLAQTGSGGMGSATGSGGNQTSGSRPGAQGSPDNQVSMPPSGSGDGTKGNPHHTKSSVHHDKPSQANKTSEGRQSSAPTTAGADSDRNSGASTTGTGMPQANPGDQ